MTLGHVARVAGVSQATVSRVINGRTGSSAETTLRVMRAVEQVGYVPKPPGRRQGMRKIHRRASTGAIAFIQLDDSHLQHTDIATRLQRGVAHALAERGMDLVIAYADGAEHLPPAVLNGRVDGLLLSGTGVSRAMADRLRPFPTVWLTSRWNHEYGDQVLSGNDQVGRVAAEYLSRAGCTHLLFLNPTPRYGVYRMRGVAFEVSARHAGLPLETLVASESEPDADPATPLDRVRVQLRPLIPRLKALADGSLGLFVPDDMIAAVLYPLLHEAGVHPSRDVTIVSCGNQGSYLAAMSPRPATIDLGPETVGRRSVEQLLWRISNPREARPVCLNVMPIVVPPERPFSASSRRSGGAEDLGGAELSGSSSFHLSEEMA